MPSRFRLVFVAHHQHRELGGLANLLVELAFGGVLVRHQRDLPAVVIGTPSPDRLHQKVAFPVDRAEAPLLDFQQLVGNARGLQSIAEIGREHAQFLPLGELGVFPEQALDLTP